RMAGGDQRLTPQVSRIAVLLVAVSCVAIAAIAPVAVPLVYGAGFSAAVPMLLILLLNPIPGTVVAVLSSALTGSGRPGATLKPQAVGLLIGAPLLVVLLPRFGGLGAAGITVLSSCITASLLLREAPKAFGGSFREYIFPTLGDLGTLRKRIQLELF
ncbi:MAG TPA: polysaccharide biosynthesis C-terminal domain-containing protein, partial [Solirubrobacteraceae bacterium]